MEESAAARGEEPYGQYLGRISFSAVRVETWAMRMLRPDSDGYY
jgi:hypothetical protein